MLNATKLNAIPAKKLERRKRAVDALRGHTLEVIQRLRDDEDELLAGRKEFRVTPNLNSKP